MGISDFWISRFPDISNPRPSTALPRAHPRPKPGPTQARFEISGNLEIQKSKILKSLSQGFGQVQNYEIFVARATQNVKILSSFLGDMFQKYGGHFSEKKKRLRQRRGPSRASRNMGVRPCRLTHCGRSCRPVRPAMTLGAPLHEQCKAED